MAYCTCTHFKECSLCSLKADITKAIKEHVPDIIGFSIFTAGLYYITQLIIEAVF